MMQHRLSPKTSTILTGLSLLILGLALITASIGLFWQDGGKTFSFTPLQGETVEIYGKGLYSLDTLFVSATNRGTDAVTLFLGIPLLAVSTLLAQQGSLRGALLRLGTLFYFLYVYASLALGAVNYNPLFLIYVAVFSASLYAFILAFMSIDADSLAAHFTPRLPRRGPALFMIVSGLVTLVVWLIPLVIAVLQQQPPARLDIYTGRVTDALDLGIITPATFVSGGLILRRVPFGYLIALSLLILEIMLLPMIAAQTVSQISLGISLTPGEIVGPLAGFASLGLVGFWVIFTILRNISEQPVS